MVCVSALFVFCIDVSLSSVCFFLCQSNHMPVPINYASCVLFSSNLFLTTFLTKYSQLLCLPSERTVPQKIISALSRFPFYLERDCFIFLSGKFYYQCYLLTQFFFNCLGKRSSQWPGCGHHGGGKSFSNQTTILK